MTAEGPIFPAPDALAAFARANARAYAQADPFPHVVVDGFFPPEVLDGILEEFPRPESEEWIRFDRGREKKLASRGDGMLGPRTRALIGQLNSSAFLWFLEELTGITGLIPDPHLAGGGLHQIVRGGHLDIHVDFNRHEHLRLDRRLNLLVYLNKDWRDEYQGHLELWSADMERCARKLLPVFNRMVLFSTTDFSLHGHPDPLQCPEGRSRKSLALYYYSNGRPAHELRPGHSTQFRSRPGDRVKLSWDVVVTKLAPPILLDAARLVRAAARGRKGRP